MNVQTDLSLIYEYCEFSIYGNARMNSLSFARDAYHKSTLSTMIRFGVSESLLY
jgi:hypothetical protein